MGKGNLDLKTASSSASSGGMSAILLVDRDFTLNFTFEPISLSKTTLYIDSASSINFDFCS
jgi:hypothetical protein